MRINLYEGVDALLKEDLKGELTLNHRAYSAVCVFQRSCKIIIQSVSLSKQ